VRVITEHHENAKAKRGGGKLIFVHRQKPASKVANGRPRYENRKPPMLFHVAREEESVARSSGVCSHNADERCVGDISDIPHDMAYDGGGGMMTAEINRAV
jgi:hypothetical protein